MQYYYGDLTTLRLLDEAEFWKHQEHEHTVVIRKIAPDLEQKYVEKLDQWEDALRKTHHDVVRLVETVVRSGTVIPPALNQEVIQYMHFAMEQSSRFVNLLHSILQDSEAIKKNNIAMTVINHIIRESQYFIGIAQTILYSGR